MPATVARLAERIVKQILDPESTGWGISNIEITWEKKRAKLIRLSNQEVLNFRDR